MTKSDTLLFTITYLSVSLSYLAIALVSYADYKSLDDSDSRFKETHKYRRQKESIAFRAKSSLAASIIFLLIFLLTSLTSEFNPSILLN